MSDLVVMVWVEVFFLNTFVSLNKHFSVRVEISSILVFLALLRAVLQEIFFHFSGKHLNWIFLGFHNGGTLTSGLFSLTSSNCGCH